MPVTPVLGLPFPLASDTADVPRDLEALALAVEAQGLLPAGVIQLWPAAAAPSGWSLCQGGTVPAADNPKLVAIFGSAGGLVTLPDFRGRGALGASGSGDMALRSAAGQTQQMLTSLHIPRHTHGFNNSVPTANAWGFAFNTPNGTGAVLAAQPSSAILGVPATNEWPTTGIQTAVDTRGSFYSLNFIIKLG